MATTLYDINKQFYKQLPSFDRRQMLVAFDRVKQFVEEHNHKWYMLLSNDRRDYTVFHDKSRNGKKLASEIENIITSRGELKGIEVRNDDIDFWVESDDNVSLYKLFNYTWGVIEV